MAKNVAFTYDIYIGASAAKVWKGIVDGEMTKHYVYGTRLESKLKKGAPYAYVGDGDFKIVDGEILEIEPEKRLVMSWKAHWDDSVAKDRASRVSYELSAAGPSTTRLHIVHDDFDGQTATYSGSVEWLAADAVFAQEPSRNGKGAGDELMVISLGGSDETLLFPITQSAKGSLRAQ